MIRDIMPSAPGTAAALGLDLNGIMWCDRTLNPGLAGCAYASPACGTADRSSACYAEVTAAGIVRKGRSENAAPGMREVADFYAKGLTEGRWTGRVHVDPSRIGPAFAKLPKKAGRVRRVFVTSMSDLFHKDVPFEFLDLVFAEMTKRRHLTFQVLTKRADRMAEYAAWRESGGGKAWNVTFPYESIWPRNVWAGTTVEDQRRADERIPHLLRVPAAVRFLSAEPMLGRIDLSRWLCMRERVEKPHDRMMYGTTHRVAPRLVERVFGNGEAMICLTPTARAPNYYVVRIDSGWHLDDEGGLREHLDDIYDAIEEQFGAFLDGDDPESWEWPMSDFSMGSSWGSYDFPGAPISWVIIGSESDGPRPGARETRDGDVLDLVDQCDTARVAVFVKQLAIGGKLCALPMVRGRVRAEFPEVAP